MVPHREPSDLASADSRIATLEGMLMRQRGYRDQLAQQGLSTAVAKTLLDAGEAVLVSLKAYRKFLLLMPHQ